VGAPSIGRRVVTKSRAVLARAGRPDEPAAPPILIETTEVDGVAALLQLARLHAHMGAGAPLGRFGFVKRGLQRALTPAFRHQVACNEATLAALEALDARVSELRADLDRGRENPEGA
jgi:hypothetical protein